MSKAAKFLDKTELSRHGELVPTLLNTAVCE